MVTTVPVAWCVVLSLIFCLPAEAAEPWPGEPWAAAVNLSDLDSEFGQDLSGAHWNAETEKATGIPEAGARGRTLGEVFPHYDILESTIAAAMADRLPRRLEKCRAPGAEGPLYFDIMVYPLLDEGLEGGGGEFRRAGEDEAHGGELRREALGVRR